MSSLVLLCCGTGEEEGTGWDVQSNSTAAAEHLKNLSGECGPLTESDREYVSLLCLVSTLTCSATEVERKTGTRPE